MTEPHSRRGSPSTIRGWMIAIAVIGLTLGTMVAAPAVFVLLNFVLFEALALIRFAESRRRGPMSGWALAVWALSFTIVIPIVSLITSLTAIYVYCSVNPNAFS
jgi:hypothetical protein